MNIDCLKFRVWDKENKRYFGEWDYDAILKEDGSLFFLCSYYGHILEFTETEMAKKGNFIVERCTGLKDRNGQLICQGDVIKNPDYPSLWFVVWNEEHACFEKLRLDGYKSMKKDFPRKSETWIFSNTTSATLIAEVECKYNEVVGNIHEAKWGIESDDDKSYKTNKSYGDEGKSEVKG